MQTTHKISGDAAAGYAEYLTTTSARGDYYTSDEGGRARSRWHGSPQLLERLGIDGEAPVERADLTALMAGVSPLDGGELRRAGANGTRVAGIDLTFSAPKSASALWAVASPYERAQIEAAHTRAVAGAVKRIERDVALVRSRPNGVLEWDRARALLAAEFVHTASRLARDQERGGVPDPQLHSHVVVLGAERQDGRFAAVDSRELFRSARGNGAWYRAELAHALQQLGLAVRGRTGRGGRYFELAGVPQALAERWSTRASEIERAARAFRTRYGRDPRAGELGSLTVATRGTKALTAARDVDDAWRAVAEEYGLTRARVDELFAGRVGERESSRDLGRELLHDVTAEAATAAERDVRARAYELAPGVCHPRQADAVRDGLVRAGELVELEGGLWTTRELRELERRTLESVAERAGERVAPVGESALRRARVQVQRDLGAPLSREQRDALAVITGRGGVTVMVGEAGTGKGVVIAAAARAWEREGCEVIGTAVAGATAKRLGSDAGIERTMTVDALAARAEKGSVELDSRTVVVMDEAGMTDTRRLAAVSELTARAGSKLVLVGDHAQLPAIGAGGLFGALQERVPTARVSEVRRARAEWERSAWGEVREGEATRALARYRARERLHVADTRMQAAERMVEEWERAREAHPGQRTVMLTDASNAEMDKMNAMAQERRARAGELGRERVELPERPYGLAAGDEVMFTKTFRPPGRERIENGTTGHVIAVGGAQRMTVSVDGLQPGEVDVDTREFGGLRLAYAQHVYKAQGRTVDRAFVLTGGWQTDRERTYVALTRARDRTDIHVAREDLGEEGLDEGAIERLAKVMERSRAQEPSIRRPSVNREREAPARSVGRGAGRECEDLGLTL
jgi:conjugative relaxase-like TrwC/TraI family protein